MEGRLPLLRSIHWSTSKYPYNTIPSFRRYETFCFVQLASTDLTDGLHASPAHAVALHKDIRSRHSLGMHFATFAGSDIEALEPITELVDAKKKENVGAWHEEGGFGTIDVGGTAILPITADARSQLLPVVSAASS